MQRIGNTQIGDMLNQILTKWTVAALVVLLASFYWFELRHELIRRSCDSEVRDAIRGRNYSLDNAIKAYDSLIEACMNKHIFY